MTSKKAITLDTLAGMMNTAFKDLDGRFDTLEKKVDSMYIEFSGKFDEVNIRFDRIEGKFLTSHENRISRLEDDVRVLKTTKSK